MVDCGRIDASQPINMYTLQQTGVINTIKQGVKLLGDVRDQFVCISTMSVNSCCGVHGLHLFLSQYVMKIILVRSSLMCV